MKQNRLLLHIIFWIGLYGLSSCGGSDKKIAITGSRTEMTAQWDQTPNEEALAVLAPYKQKVDSIMNPVIGKSDIDMTAKRPESLLSNLVADVLRNSAIPYIGQPADVGIINMGGLRNNLSAGDITYRNIYEILPFENALCIVTLKGSDVKDLMNDIAKVGGEGLSNVRIVINKDMDVLNLQIGGKPVDDEKLYTIATIDYLAEGNDRMTAFQKAVKKHCEPEATVRYLFIEYIKSETGKGKAITSQIEGRFTVVE